MAACWSLGLFRGASPVPLLAEHCMKTLYLHVGLPKTGTTFLQSRIFPGFPVSYIHKSNNRKQADLIHFCHRFFRVKTLEKLGSEAEIVKGLNVLTKKIADPSHDRVLLSDENISISLSGVWEQRVATAEQFALRLRQFAEFIKTMGAETHVICSVRRQDSWLASRYAESAKRAEDFSQAGFEAFVGGEYLQVLAAESVLNYDKLYRETVRQFGAAGCSFLTYESLERDPAGHIGRLHAIIVGDTAPSSRALEAQDNRSRVAEDSWQLKNASGGLLRLTPELRHAILAPFRDSNAAFIREAGDLVGDLAETA